MNAEHVKEKVEIDYDLEDGEAVRDLATWLFQAAVTEQMQRGMDVKTFNFALVSGYERDLFMRLANAAFDYFAVPFSDPWDRD